MSKGESVGKRVRRELLGARKTEELDSKVYSDPYMERLGVLAEGMIFETLWTRGVIGLKTRTLATVAADIATGQTEALSLHLRYALNSGWTQDELAEVILHLTGYVGVPQARRAMLVASETFAVIARESKDENTE